VVGAGPAGLEAARVAALRGHAVTVVESGVVGGLAAVAGPGRPLVDWLVRECEMLGVQLRGGVASDEWSRLVPSHDVVIQATGSRRGVADYTIGDGALVHDIADVRTGRITLPESGDIAVLDPIGGPIGVALAEELGSRAVLVTPDNIAGNELSRTGDLAPANVRLAQKGVRIERRSVVRAVEKHGSELNVRLQDRFSGEVRSITVSAVVDAGFRLPAEPLPIERATSVGDCVAPRTLYEAVLEGRRAAVTIS
jgi:2,4-dienoyl-CoA reductase (NADPH2)